MVDSIVFVGGGNMAAALISGALRAGWVPGKIAVVEPVASQREMLQHTFGVEVHSSFPTLEAVPKMVIWALKPQVMKDVVEEVGERVSRSLHLSIAAGVELAKLASWLQSGRVVRAMPNTSAMVSEGVTGLCAGPNLAEGDRELVERFFGGSGTSFWVADDERMNAVTALTGSGPAYVFHFLEGLQDAAMTLGFNSADARQLALQVARGAVKQASESQDDVRLLRERVTSKGGTTAAATAVLDRCETQHALIEAVRAAYSRARELAAAAQ